MFIISFYLFWIGYGYIFFNLFNLDFSLVTQVSFYALLIAAIIIAFILSFITQLLIVEILGLIRKNTAKDSRLNHNFANSLLRFAMHLTRTKIIVSGKENIPKHKFILVSNHQENYDILILKPIFKEHNLNFIAKESLRKMPIIGRWITLLGNIYISRQADRSAARSIIRGIKEYKNGHPMAIFPEGKRSFQNELIDFKAGAFKLATKPKADILIVTLYNVCKIFKRFPIPKYKVYVHIHPLLKYEDYKNLNTLELSAKVKDIIQQQLTRFSQMKKGK
ncbi:MAG: 1-acyl-sn-glycerol-3-phosphate acyltransferase [Candidatus Izimaplasma sp.]|nr:1-acyl-sn-glycerol-3-phosphate acyltransferase [Candidatus Izimaplasma bacterium]